MSELATKTCLPCSGWGPRLSPEEREAFLEQLEGRRIVDGHHLTKQYEFDDFVDGLAFVNRLGDVAEREGHHPDIHLSWGRVGVDIWTHKVDGLTESDFVLAAKTDVARTVAES